MEWTDGTSAQAESFSCSCNGKFQVSLPLAAVNFDSSGWVRVVCDGRTLCHGDSANCWHKPNQVSRQH